jgi:hypothetical protein
MPSPLAPLDAAKAYADAWATLDFSRFVALLAPNARYASQYVFEELVGRDAIHSYLTGKAAAVRRSGSAVTAELCRATRCFPGAPCVRLTQGGENAVIVFETAGSYIRRFDLCITELYAPVPLPSASDTARS